MAETSIEWTDHSINPLRAKHRVQRGLTHGHHCEKVSEGCKNCYASRLQPRFGLPEFSGPSRREVVSTYLDSDKLSEVLRRKKPTRYFWCDMSDLFGSWVTNEDLNRCFAVMSLTPHHTHQVLTKRPERMREYVSDPERGWNVSQWMAGNGMVPATWGGELPAWPPPNVWLGVSVENQQTADERIPHLLRTPAAVRFLSCEPLLSEVNLGPWLGPWTCDGEAGVGKHDGKRGPGSYCGSCCRDYGNSRGPVDWVIVGGESGPHARPMHPDWPRSLRDQCAATGVPFFFKQWGEHLPCGMATDQPHDTRRPRSGPDGFVTLGKKAAGRLLDGVLHDEFPRTEGVR